MDLVIVDPVIHATMSDHGAGSVGPPDNLAECPDESFRLSAMSHGGRSYRRVQGY